MNVNLNLRNSQLKLLVILASGVTLKEAGAILNISVNTVKARVKTLYSKFQVKTRADLIKQAFRNDIINSKDIKPRFRKRFINIEVGNTKPVLREPLTDEEVTYLNYASKGMTQSEIIKLMSLSGIYHARILVITICYKLCAQNILEAVVNANKLENILKPLL